MNTTAAAQFPYSLFNLTLTQKNRRPTWFAICSLLMLLGNPGNASGVSFSAPTSYPVGTSPVAIALGDFNGDGKMDIAVANTGSGDVSILLGNGDGTFQAAVSSSAGNSPNAIAVGDFNGDGKLDLAVFQAGANGVAGSVSILLGNGDGTFQSPKALALSASAKFMVVADFNVDKKSDLAVCDSTNLDTFIGNGDGTFQASKQTALSSGCLGLVTSDFNGDSKPDLALVTSAGSTSAGIQILLGNGDGTFSNGASISAAGVSLPVLVTDLNHDSKVDLVVNTSQTNCSSPPICQTFRNLTVFLGNGDGTFQKGRIVASISFSGRGPLLDNPFAGDFNGDGKLDLAYQTTPPTTGDTNVLLGRGDGSFSLPVLSASFPGKQTIAQDLNGDKLDDLIAIGATNNIEVWLNNSPTSGADLSLVSPNVSAGPYLVGANMTFTADVLNQGPQDATGVTFTDTLPNGLSFVSATATQGSCVQSNGVVTCNIGSLASAFDASVSIVVTPTAVGSITNTMNVTATQPDLAPANNSASQNLTVVPLETLTVTDAGKGSGTVTSSPGAINCGSTCSGNFAQGTTVSLTASPATGSVFSAWSGACTGTDPNNCSVAMSSAQAVTATFNPAPDFTLAAASASFTLQTGAQTTDALTLTAQNGFSGQVTLSCTVIGPVPLTTCGVSPSSVAVGSNPGTSTLTITAPTSLSVFARPMNDGSQLAALAAAIPVPAFLLGGIVFALRRSEKRRASLWFLGGLIVFVAVIAGCGGGSQPLPPQNYTVTVTAASASGSIQHSAPVSVTVE